MICSQCISVSLLLSYKAVDKNALASTSIMINYRGNASKRKTWAIILINPQPGKSWKTRDFPAYSEVSCKETATAQGFKAPC